MSDEPRGPGPDTVMRSVAAWERARLMLATDPELAADENAIRDAIGLDPTAVHPDQLIRRAMRALVFAGLRVDEAKSLTASATRRSRRYIARAQALRTLIFDLMEVLSYPKFITPYGTVTLKRSGNPTVLVTDEAQIPDGYFLIERTLDKRLLLADLKVGVVVDGAVLANAAPTIAISGAPHLILSADDSEPAAEQPEAED
jgi:Gp157 protein